MTLCHFKVTKSVHCSGTVTWVLVVRTCLNPSSVWSTLCQPFSVWRGPCPGYEPTWTYR